jgi:hypothetical protein
MALGGSVSTPKRSDVDVDVEHNAETSRMGGRPLGSLGHTDDERGGLRLAGILGAAF